MKNIKRTKKRYVLISLLLTFLTLASLVLFVLSSCGNNPPELDEVKERAIYLIENSRDITRALFGSGLDTYKIGSEEAESLKLYDNNYAGVYEFVKEEENYDSIDDLRIEAAKYYSSEFLASVEDTLFVGDFTTGVHLYARFYCDIEYDNWLMQYFDINEGEKKTQLEFDFDTMEIDKKHSDTSHVTIKLMAYGPGINYEKLAVEDMWQEVSIFLVLEDGEWFLGNVLF